MSMVRFAMLCDQCGARSEEYGAWYTCTDCVEDVCTACIVTGSEDDETGKAQCKCCAAADLADVMAQDFVCYADLLAGLLA